MTEDERIAAAIKKAREQIAHDNISIDDQPSTSVAGEGVWVNAWIYIEDDE